MASTITTFFGNIKRAAVFPLFFVAIMWAVFLIENLLGSYFGVYGILPRDWTGLRGVFLSPFIHGGWEHLTHNSLPMLILGTMLFFFYKRVAWQVFFYSMLMTGVWVWVGARSSFHIGASGMIYAFASFLFFSGVFNRNLRMMGVSLFIAFMYGSMWWGVLPLEKGVSWESHLFGAISGVVIAWQYKKVGPQRKKYDLESGLDKLQEQYGEEYWNRPEVDPRSEELKRRISIRYIFKPREENKK